MKEIFKAIIEKMDLMRFAIAFVIMAIFFIIVNALIYREIPANNKEILIHVLGIIEGAVMTIVSYEFGSSKSSAKKTDVIDKMIDKQP